MILGINHVALSVPDFDKAVEFYCTHLGFELLFDGGWKPTEKDLPGKILGVKGTEARVGHLKHNNVLVELFEFSAVDVKTQEPNRPVVDHGYTHICFAVTDIQSEYKRLCEAGVRFHHAPLEVARNVFSAYGRDPFGNVIEIEEAIGREIPNAPPITPKAK
jgi:glyoxylase I family protein